MHISVKLHHITRVRRKIEKDRRCFDALCPRHLKCRRIYRRFILTSDFDIFSSQMYRVRTFKCKTPCVIVERGSIEDRDPYVCSELVIFFLFPSLLSFHVYYSYYYYRELIRRRESVIVLIRRYRQQVLSRCSAILIYYRVRDKRVKRVNDSRAECSGHE